MACPVFAHASVALLASVLWGERQRVLKKKAWQRRHCVSRCKSQASFRKSYLPQEGLLSSMDSQLVANRHGSPDHACHCKWTAPWSTRWPRRAPIRRAGQRSS